MEASKTDSKGLSSKKAFKGVSSPFEVGGIAGQGTGSENGATVNLGGFSDASGRPSERYYWSHYGRVMTERRTELGYPYLNPLEPTFREIIDNETITKEGLGYDR